MAHPCCRKPCHNGGSCTSKAQMNNTQGGFQTCWKCMMNIIIVFGMKTSSWNRRVKLWKVFECSCPLGFTGDFCEFKAEQDHLLYLYLNATLVFNGDGKFVTESVAVDANSEAYRSCFTMLNGEAVIFGGSSTFGIDRQVTHSKRKYVKYLFFKISVVSGCKVRRIGDLPFHFDWGTCGTFMFDNEPTILLCFYDGEEKRCRSLKRKNDAALNTINRFEFYDEFELDTIEIPDSKYDHYRTKMANYQGFPLILGLENVKLEMLVTVESPFEWIEGPDYPYGQE